MKTLIHLCIKCKTKKNVILMRTIQLTRITIHHVCV